MLDRAVFLAKQLARDQRAITRRRRRIVRDGMSLEELSGSAVATVLSWPRRFGTAFGDPDPKGPIWAVMMAQNEEVRISTPVRHLVEQGVDVVVVVNNLSTDRTAEVLGELARGLPLVAQLSGWSCVSLHSCTPRLPRTSGRSLGHEVRRAIPSVVGPHQGDTRAGARSGAFELVVVAVTTT